jgi:uncharacterized protein
MKAKRSRSRRKPKTESLPQHPKGIASRAVAKPNRLKKPETRGPSKAVESRPKTPSSLPTASPPEVKTDQPAKPSPARSSPASKAQPIPARSTTPESLPTHGTPADEPAATELHLKIPAILFEGDQPSAPPPPKLPRVTELAGLTPAIAPSEGELPDAYGTGRLFLTPRDPRCLCAQWDLSAEQLRYHNDRAVGHHLVLRFYLGRSGGERIAEMHVHPESRHWFMHVDRAGATYVAELGYHMAGGQWHTVAVSEPVPTPVETPAESGGVVRFARFELETKPEAAAEPQWPSPKVPELGPHFKAPTRILSPFVRESGAEAPGPAALGRPGLPRLPQPLKILAPAAAGGPIQAEAPPTVRRVPLTSRQKEVLWDLIGVTVTRKLSMNSAEISELVSGQAGRAISSAAGLPEVSVSSPAGVALGEVTSPGAPGPVPREAFWFNVNAELIIYGATEPDAQVTIGQRTIRLRSDGTFSYRFALPDGEYSLPITATAQHGDQRCAELSFYRATRYTGVVAAHPQDPALKTPTVENVS